MTDMKNVSGIYEGQFWLAMIRNDTLKQGLYIIFELKKSFCTYPIYGWFLHVFGWCSSQIKDR